jgi:hypothetical protein
MHRWFAVMPIECYSGWLQDDSFGGPCAERERMDDSNGAQICTWRNLTVCLPALYGPGPVGIVVLVPD